MKQLDLIRRYDVSPVYLEQQREIFKPLEYLIPRNYTNNSRYQNLRRIQDTENNKIYHENWKQKFIDVSSSDIYYVVTIETADRLDIIANIYYSTPKYWWVIALANYIIDPFDIPVGTKLRIPLLASLSNEGGIFSGS